MRLAGKAALITGAGSGIGEACALLFATEGARVVAADLREDTAASVAARIRDAGGEAVAVGGDVSSRADAELMVRRTVEACGRLDVLVNSAGVTPRYARPGADFEEVWDWVVGVNLKGTYLMCWYAVEQMRKTGSGAIVNVASIMGLVSYHQSMGPSSPVAPQGFNPYHHSKGGVVNLTREMAVGLAKNNIRVNALAPGFAKTHLTRTLWEDEKTLALLESLHPLGRLATTEEIAKAALFLASDEASFITGVILPVDGGYTAQ
ncbi:MAG: SDR family oxidoreductase [Gemmatimonadetes bacterium]|nr:SDR family oxidoreductase [Gemmatimonadota bacterium]